MDKLTNRVWKTKKIRMEAEARRLTLKRQWDLILNGTTILALVLSILSLYSYTLRWLVSDQGATLLTIILSVLSAISALIITAYDFKGEAVQFRQSYMELTSIEDEIDCEDKNVSNEELAKLRGEYTESLSKTINHTALDCLYFEISQWRVEKAKRKSLREKYGTEKQKVDENVPRPNFPKWVAYYVSRYFFDILFGAIVVALVILIVGAVMHA